MSVCCVCVLCVGVCGVCAVCVEREVCGVGGCGCVLCVCILEDIWKQYYFAIMSFLPFSPSLIL